MKPKLLIRKESWADISSSYLDAFECSETKFFMAVQRIETV